MRKLSDQLRTKSGIQLVFITIFIELDEDELENHGRESEITPIVGVLMQVAVVGSDYFR